MSKTVYLAKITSEKLESLLIGFEKHLKETDRGKGGKSKGQIVNLPKRQTEYGKKTVR